MARLVPKISGRANPFTSLSSDDDDDIEECDVTDTTTRVTFPEEMFEIQNLGDRDGIRRRGTIREISRTPKQAPPKDDTLFSVKDDERFSVFEKGRDYEPVYITHQYTEQEIDTLNTYESCDYLPSHSHIYKHWIKRQLISKLETDRWIMMGLIGVAVGFIGFLLHQLIERIGDLKWQTTKSFLKEEKLWQGWLFCTGYSVVFAVFSAAIIVLWRPSAGGSGMAEVTGFLNGTQVRRIFNVKTMAAKFLSCVAAIGCGMPIGPEGPMVHLGAIVGAGFSQTSSSTLKIKLPFFERFRNPEDRRNFISAGVAAGVAAAFGAPVGGLLFCMEEVSSFWSRTLMWQVFFCCIIATSTSDIFNSTFERFQVIGMFGEFRTSRYILFNVDEAVDINVLMFIPSVMIGVIGGLLGSLLRKKILTSIQSAIVVKILRLLEPALIMLIMSSFAVFLPMAFKCIPFTCIRGNSGILSQYCVNDTTNKYDSHYVEENIFHTCETGSSHQNGSTLVYNGTYNELALLLFVSKEEAMKNLYLRNSHKMFGYGPLFVSLGVYFFMVIWAAGTSVAAGILVPMLLIGALYGRIVGLVMVDMFGVYMDDSYWSWMDPGAFALIGSASFFGGVSRLAPATTVIMMELTNDLKVLLPVMTAVMVAKWVGDYFTHPFFHAQLELKCIPFLDRQPHVTIHKRNVKLELFSAEDIMAFPVITMNRVERVTSIAHILLDYQHNGFPVLHKNAEGKKVFYGMITRSELLVILKHPDVLHRGRVDPMDDKNLEIAPIAYNTILKGLKLSEEEISEYLHEFISNNSEYKDYYVDLTPYVNQSAMSVPTKFSLHRSYTLISALGLRHLTVVDSSNQVQGIITRKDLMGFHMVETLSALINTKDYFDSSLDGEARHKHEDNKPKKAKPADSKTVRHQNGHHSQRKSVFVHIPEQIV
ncbi:unnamed protein product [Candidula unifasciata]|uniref:Chloride channel protein n=1 Tax=Candidula unifasciata TaxID=100452 RepID=A0A8S3Z0A8_9EUPU|nr:unnamed protein product [Candidula unifasciata]